jgi:hypothetical protein
MVLRALYVDGCPPRLRSGQAKRRQERRRGVGVLDAKIKRRVERSRALDYQWLSSLKPELGPGGTPARIRVAGWFPLRV